MEINNPTPNDREILSSRVFKAPRAAIFNAWTDPVRLARWWGPEGFSNTFHEFSLFPGGRWIFTMHGPNGKGYHNESIFSEIIENELIVLDHISPPAFRVAASFNDHPEGTLLHFRMIFATAEACAKVKVYAVDANEQNFDRLEAVLAEM